MFSVAVSDYAEQNLKNGEELAWLAHSRKFSDIPLYPNISI